ncbi:MATE family efflux transporter [Exilibacterium tricleocarpae]|uniref:MATE family efflux transporter n=1 Tax=Exilibacterium tricleocarpae TaxID=2591008 RepID=A0A545T0K4_9GAMM|nr:MATE family efflux transporter [Exilibacterium tricleocarpae]TQV70709.1 MATE family efflux transporter [Exilibacterium tricleocarpae]
MKNTLPNRAVLALAWPMILSNISVPLLGIVDTAILGHLDSAVFLAAVAAGSAIITFLLWGFGFLRMGTTSLVAQAVGRGDDRACVRLLLVSLVMALSLGVMLIALQPLVIPLAVGWIDPAAGAAELARSYCQIRLFSAPAALANFALMGWFIGRQNTKVPLLVVVATNSINIVLDFIFIMGFGWQSDGAAAATAIADYCGLGLALWCARRHLVKLSAPVDLRDLVVPASYWDLLRVNRQLFVRTACLLFTFAFFTAQGARMGNQFLAANAIMMQLLLLVSHGLDGFAHAAEALVGKATGEKNLAVFMGVCKSATLWSLIIALGFTGVFYVFEHPLIRLFSDIDSIIQTLNRYYTWLLLLPLVSVWSYMLDGIFIGAGQTGAMQNSMLFACLAVFIPVWWLSQAWANHGLWLAFLCFNGARGLTMGVLFVYLTRTRSWFSISATPAP